MPLTKGLTWHKPEIQWRNWGETGGGHCEKQNALPTPGWKKDVYKVTSGYTAMICRWQPNFPFRHTVKNCAIVLWISCSSFCGEVLSVGRRMCLFEVRSSQVQTTFLRSEWGWLFHFGLKKTCLKLILGLLAWVWPGEVIDSNWIICG
jgi:hypothetical protein